jgi:hypothetical protein
MSLNKVHNKRSSREKHNPSIHICYRTVQQRVKWNRNRGHVGQTSPILVVEIIFKMAEIRQITTTQGLQLVKSLINGTSMKMATSGNYDFPKLS